MAINFLSELTGSFAMPAREDPTVAMIESAYRHHKIVSFYVFGGHGFISFVHYSTPRLLEKLVVFFLFTLGLRPTEDCGRRIFSNTAGLPLLTP